jgi:hypothetical protein
MALRIWLSALLLAAAHFGPAVAQGSISVMAIEPASPGVLTKCRNWLVATSCNTYHHIVLPPRVAVGDTFTVTFGSSPKQYAFPVARIMVRDDRCVIFSERDGDERQIDRITVDPCHRADEER